MVDYTYPTNISIASLLTHDYGIKSVQLIQTIGLLALTKIL